MATNKVTKQELNEILENIKPLNYGRRLYFQYYCKYLVRTEKICECDVEDFLSDEFLYEDNEPLERAHKRLRLLKNAINITVNFATLYFVYKIIKRGL